MRSWEALNVEGNQRVVIIGRCPEWYDGEHIPHESNGSKYEQVLARLRIAASEIAGRWLWMNDDFVVNRWFPAHQYHLGPLKPKVASFGGEYKRAALRTLDVLNDIPQPLNFSAHCAFAYESVPLTEVLDEIGDEPALVRTVYAHRHPDDRWREIHDSKAMRPDQVAAFAKLEWWSVNSSGPTVDAALEVLRKTFPVPGRWENGL
jgi:hypothetical protein